MKGAEVVLKALEREGVSVVFGHPGGAILPTYDALAPYEADGRIHHVLVRHEQCAAHMADGYARASGRPSLVNLHSAAGTGHSLGNLFTAWKNNAPIMMNMGTGPSVNREISVVELATT